VHIRPSTHDGSIGRRYILLIRTATETGALDKGWTAFKNMMEDVLRPKRSSWPTLVAFFRAIGLSTITEGAMLALRWRQRQPWFTRQCTSRLRHRSRRSLPRDWRHPAVHRFGRGEPHSHAIADTGPGPSRPICRGQSAHWCARDWTYSLAQEQWPQFTQWLEKQGKSSFDVIIDGANVGCVSASL
jgi:hypothetical protein